MRRIDIDKALEDVSAVLPDANPCPTSGRPCAGSTRPPTQIGGLCDEPQLRRRATETIDTLVGGRIEYLGTLLGRAVPACNGNELDQRKLGSTGVNIAGRFWEQREYLRRTYESVHGNDPAA